jgi:hypothetical protein
LDFFCKIFVAAKGNLPGKFPAEVFYAEENFTASFMPSNPRAADTGESCSGQYSAAVTESLRIGSGSTRFFAGW